jgi:uncharacterized repeat protein (TIGR01451 family)
MDNYSTWSITNVRLALVVPMVIATASIGFANPAFAAGTAAGTTISNTATASYNDAGGAPRSVTSNQVDLLVDEILDVVVAPESTTDVVTQPSLTDQVLTYTITNKGNGPEAFVLTSNGTVGGDQFDPNPTSILLDINDNGIYEPGIDPVYTGATPALAAEQTLRVFVRSTIPASANDADRGIVSLTGQAVTGTGTPGTNFAGAGVGGSNAVVGATGADDVANRAYLVQNATIAFVKSQSVSDPFGGTKSVPGAIITYTLVATISGTGTLANVAVSDGIPANTTYQAGSLTLQAAGLSDAADADAGRTVTTGAVVTGIDVALGSVAGGQTRSVTFRVKIN